MAKTNNINIASVTDTDVGIGVDNIGGEHAAPEPDDIGGTGIADTGRPGSDDSETSGNSDGGLQDPLSGIDTGATKPSAGADPDAGTKRTRAPRQAGTGASKTAKPLGLNNSGQGLLAKQVVGVHKLFALFSGLPVELVAITDEQGEQLTQAVLAVMAEYKIKANPKMVCWANLAGVCAMVYTPKIIMAINYRKAVKAKQAETQAPMRSEPAATRPVSNTPNTVVFG